MTATQAQCDRWREEDIADAMGHVARCITHPLTSNQLGAFTDAAFNLGPQVVCGSTLQRKANAGDIAGACAELDRWINAHGRPYRGLILRRADERAICWPRFTNVQGGVLP
jgi:lysozyme